MTPVVCPQCRSRWSSETKVSWWLTHDRCWSCIADAVGCGPTDGDCGRLPTPAEAAVFCAGQLDLFGGAT